MLAAFLRQKPKTIFGRCQASIGSTVVGCPHVTSGTSDKKRQYRSRDASGQIRDPEAIGATDLQRGLRQCGPERAARNVTVGREGHGWQAVDLAPRYAMLATGWYVGE
jgi:hypothetical protein